MLVKIRYEDIQIFKMVENQFTSLLYVCFLPVLFLQVLASV